MTAETMPERPVYTPPVIPLGGNEYMRDARGALVPVEVIAPKDLLEDQTVGTIIMFARDLSAQIARFRSHCFADIGTYESILAERYQTKLGGRKGNMTLTSYDGLSRVLVQISDQITFGPEIRVAKTLIDECLTEWGAESRAELRALVDRVFAVGKEGEINRAEVFSLLRLEVTDPRWLKAMEAIRESIRTVGTKAYVRFQERRAPDAEWTSITINIAVA